MVEIYGSLHSPPLKTFRPRKGKRKEKEELEIYIPYANINYITIKK